MILKDLPVGTKVREPQSSLAFLVADHNHIAYSGTSLVTDCAVKLASFDAVEADNPEKDQQEYGNNFYPLSNIHQWLNSNETNWFKPAHQFDASPVLKNIDQGRQDFYDVPFYSTEAKFTGNFSYNNEPGFLTWFTREFVDSLCEVNVQCCVPAVPGERRQGPATSAYFKSRVFLLSAPEIGLEHSKNSAEGFRFSLFNDGRMRVVAPIPAAVGQPADYVYDDCSLFYWLRTPAPGSSDAAMIYNAEHRNGDTNGSPTGRLPARAICGVRPALNIESGLSVSDEPDMYGVYSLILGVG